MTTPTLGRKFSAPPAGDPTSGGDGGNSGGDCPSDDPTCGGGIPGTNGTGPDCIPLAGMPCPSDGNPGDCPPGSDCTLAGALCGSLGLFCETATLQNNLETDTAIYNETLPANYPFTPLGQSPDAPVLMQINYLESINLIIDNVALGLLASSALNAFIDTAPPGLDRVQDLAAGDLQLWRNYLNQQIDQFVGQVAPKP